MKKLQVIVLVLVSVLMLAAVPMAEAKTGKLTINNKIGGNIYISFEGPRNYSFFVGDGKTIQTMEQGEYTYSFFADGDTVVGTVKVKSTATLTLKLERAKLVINSKIGGNIYLQLNGPRDYGLWVALGKTNYDLVPGDYKYSFYAEGGTEKGEFTLKKSGGVLVLQIIKGKLKINSKYAQNLFVTFTGPVAYYQWVIPGKTTLEMRVGAYKYSYWYDGKTYDGSFELLKKGSTLTLEPPQVCDCRKNLYNCDDFKWQYEAQACYQYCQAQGRGDIHQLDGDHDGRACEALP